ncbi:MAG: YpsA SLOG family protein [Isosphaeraceae bacterium]
MLERILCSGPAEMIRAVRRTVRAFGLATDGGSPLDVLREDGLPADAAPASESGKTPRPASAWIEPCVRESDATLWLGDTTTACAQATVRACLRLGKPCLPIDPAASFQPGQVAGWIEKHKVKTLHVAGRREENAADSPDRVEEFLGDVLLQLGQERT